MKNELRYQTICKMLQAYDEATGNRGADHVIQNPHFWLDCPFQPFYVNAATLLIEAMEDMNTKSTGDKTIMAALKRVIKASKNNRNFDGIFETVGDDHIKRYAVCDGHRLIRLNNDYDSLRRATKHTIEDKSINQIMRTGQKEKPLPLPTIAEVKAFIAKQKAELGAYANKSERIPFNIYGDIWVNPEYLIDMLQALPGCKAYMPSNNHNPLYFEAENGDGILLPVNHKKDEEDAA